MPITGIFGTVIVNKAFCVSSRVIIDFFDWKNLRNWRSRSTKDVVQDAAAIGVVVAPATKQAIHMCGSWQGSTSTGRRTTMHQSNEYHHENKHNFYFHIEFCCFDVLL